MKSNINLEPIIKKVIDAINLRYSSGINVEIEPPARTPIKLARISADAEPKNTAKGFFEFPLKVSMAI